MKLVRSSLAIAATAAAMASSISTVEASENFRTGAYVGVEGGWLAEWHHYRQNATIVPGTHVVNTVSKKKEKESSTFFPGIFAGYRYFLNKCYFAGLEIAAYKNFSETHASFSKSIDGRTTVKARHTLEGRYNILPTAVFGRTFGKRWALYGKVGYDGGKYRYRIVETVGSLIENQRKTHKRFNHLLLGVGAEFAFNCWLSARLDYNYSFSFGHRTARMKASETAGILDYKTNLKVQTSALKLGAIIKF